VNHFFWKFRRGNLELGDLEQIILECFCDTPNCPACGIGFVDNKIKYLGSWGTEDAAIATYRVCDSCGEKLSGYNQEQLVLVAKVVSNYLKILYPHIVDRFSEHVERLVK